MSRLGKGTRRGFSLVELIMVMAIMLAVAAIAAPRFITFFSNYQLRAGLNTISNTLQQTRMIAVRQNQTLKVNWTTSGRLSVFGETANANGSWDSGEPGGYLPPKVSIQSSGFPGNATSGLNYTAEAQGTDVKFNSRGLPCVVISSICQNFDSAAATPAPAGFVIYVQNTGVYGVPGWGAVTITPAGRIQRWIWNGGGYSQQ